MSLTALLDAVGHTLAGEASGAPWIRLAVAEARRIDAARRRRTP